MTAVKQKPHAPSLRRLALLLTACIAAGPLPGWGASAAEEFPSPAASASPPPQAADLSEDKISAIWLDLIRNTSLIPVYTAYTDTVHELNLYLDARQAGAADQEARNAVYFLVRDGIAECKTLRDAIKPVSAAKIDWLTAAGRSTEGVDWAYRLALEVADAWIRELTICQFAVLYLDYLDAARLQAYAREAEGSYGAFLEYWYNTYILALLDFTDADTAKRVLAAYYTGEDAEYYEAFESYWTEDKEVLRERTAQAWMRVEESLEAFLYPPLQASTHYPWFYAYLAYATGNPAYAMDLIDAMLENPSPMEEALTSDMKIYCASLRAYLGQRLEAGDNRPFAFVYGVSSSGDRLLELGDIIVTLDGKPIPAKSVFEQEVGSDPSTVQVYRPHAGGFTKHEFQLVIDIEATQIAFFPTLENLE